LTTQQQSEEQLQDRSPLGEVLSRLDKIVELLDKKPPSKPRAEPYKATSSDTWLAYLTAYKDVHGQEPLRNATVNRHLKQLVDKLGKEYAPLVAEYYVRTYNKWYYAKLHPTYELLRDAEKLYILWQKSKVRKECEVTSDPYSEPGVIDNQALDKIRKELGYGTGATTEKEAVPPSPKRGGGGNSGTNKGRKRASKRHAKSKAAKDIHD